MTRRLVVAEGTQVNVDGRVYGPGEVLEDEPADVDTLLVRGVVAEVTEQRKASGASRKRALPASTAPAGAI